MINTEKYMKNIDNNVVKIGADLENLKKSLEIKDNILLQNIEKIINNQKLIFDEIATLKNLIKK